MRWTRRQIFLTGAAMLAGCSGAAPKGSSESRRLDDVLRAHAGARPEVLGSGASHYPMAAEALDSLGRADAIPQRWIEGARAYHGALGRMTPISGPSDGLGDRRRHGDWWDHFRKLIASESWSAVVARWVPILAPGLAGAALHGLIRTAHAVRGLSRRDHPVRRDELAHGLAYWAASYIELPGDPSLRPSARPPLEAISEAVPSATSADDDVAFDEVTALLAAAPTRPDPLPEPEAPDAEVELWALLRAAAVAFLEAFVGGRHRVWMLHTVTGPAAGLLLLPVADSTGRALLVRHLRRAVLAFHGVFGVPFVPRAHVQDRPPPWSELLPGAVASQSVHTVKLVEALHRADRDGDPVWRSVAESWLAWR